MKNYILIIALLLGAIGIAQVPSSDRNSDKRMDKEKIHALAVAYITEQLELTPEEAAQFWPVYNELRDERRRLESKKRILLRELEDKFEALTDAQASSYVNNIAQLEKEIGQASLEQNSDAIIKIVGAKRFLKLMKAEMEFRRKMLKEYKQRRGRGRP